MTARRDCVWLAIAIVLVAGMLAGADVSRADREQPAGGEAGSEPAAARAGSTAASPLLSWSVVDRYPHDPRAFTQGLLVDGDTVYESTGLRGQSSLRIVDVATGGVRRKVDLPAELFGEGLARVGDRLIQITWTSGVARVYQMSDLAVVGEHHYQGQGWGLCFDGRRLVMSDGSHRLHFRDPETFALLGSVDVIEAGAPVSLLNELECVGRHVYANVLGSWTIFRIDAESGRVDGRIDAAALLSIMEKQALTASAVLNGIAYDPPTDTFLVTGKLWPRMHRIRLVGDK